VTSGPIATIERPSRRVRVTVSSLPTFDDFVAFFNRLLADPAFHPGDDILWDREGRKELPGREYVENITRLMREKKQRIGAGRVAFVVSGHSPAHFGMGRMAQILSDWGDRFQVFTELNDAVAWLDEGRVADR
jgi:hypothetical protein